MIGRDIFGVPASKMGTAFLETMEMEHKLLYGVPGEIAVVETAAGIYIDLQSPGGEVAGAQLDFREMRRTQMRKSWARRYVRVSKRWWKKRG